jgi:hypothetical protein
MESLAASATAQQSSSPQLQQSLGSQLIGVLGLKAPMYRRIVEDPTTKRNSIVVMAIASVLSAIGLMVSSESKVQGVVQGVLAVVVGWVVAALAISLLSRLIARRKLAISVALRLTGFTSVFAFVGILGLIPGVGVIGVALGALLAPVGNSIGIREAIRVHIIKAVVIGFLAAFVEVGVAEIVDRTLSPILR